MFESKDYALIFQNIPLFRGIKLLIVYNCSYRICYYYRYYPMQYCRSNI